jgi:hypothetical protein
MIPLRSFILLRDPSNDEAPDLFQLLLLFWASRKQFLQREIRNNGGSLGDYVVYDNF